MDSIPSSKQRGSPKGRTKWKVFIGRSRWNKEVICKRKKICSGPADASRVLIRKFQIDLLGVTFLGELETWFAAVGADDTICFFFFNLIENVY